MEYQHIVTVDTNLPSKLFDQLSEANRKFEKALDQINMLDQQLRDLETRYKRAVKHKKNSFRYNLRLKLSVVTGIKMMYNHFVSKKADEIRRCTRQLEVIYGREMQDFDPRDPSSWPDVMNEQENEQDNDTSDNTDQENDISDNNDQENDISDNIDQDNDISDANDSGTEDASGDNSNHSGMSSHNESTDAVYGGSVHTVTPSDTTETDVDGVSPNGSDA